MLVTPCFAPTQLKGEEENFFCCQLFSAHYCSAFQCFLCMSPVTPLNHSLHCQLPGYIKMFCLLSQNLRHLQYRQDQSYPTRTCQCNKTLQIMKWFRFEKADSHSQHYKTFKPVLLNLVVFEDIIFSLAGEDPFHQG